MLLLKQSTAVTLALGPFVDATDGVTPETALSITQAETRLSKNGGAFAQKSDTGTATHGEEGNYLVALNTTDTNTLGVLRIAVYVSGALPCWLDCMVMPANVWDSLFGADNLQVDVAQWLGTAAATPTVAGVPEVDVTHFGGTAATAASGRPEVNTTHVAGTAQTAGDVVADTNDIQARLPAALVSGRIDASVGAVASGAITAAAIADGAIDRATFAADTGLQSIRSGTAQAGAAGSVTLDASASATTDFYVGAWVLLTGGTGAGQARVITAYNGTTKVATVAPNWATNPDATSTFAVLAAAQLTGIQGAVSGAVGSVTGNVGGNVAGSVGSVTAAVTVGTNNDKTGYALSAAGVQAIWDALTAALSTASSIGKLLVDNINATISSRSTLDAAGVRTAVGLASANLDTQLDALPTAGENADAVWDEAMTEITAVPAVTASFRDALRWLFGLSRNKLTQTATTQTLYRDDGSTTVAASTHSDDGTTHTRGEFA